VTTAPIVRTGTFRPSATTASPAAATPNAIGRSCLGVRPECFANDAEPTAVASIGANSIVEVAGPHMFVCSKPADTARALVRTAEAAKHSSDTAG
jgi:hypothetical protein